MKYIDTIIIKSIPANIPACNSTSRKLTSYFFFAVKKYNACGKALTIMDITRKHISKEKPLPPQNIKIGMIVIKYTKIPDAVLTVLSDKIPFFTTKQEYIESIIGKEQNGVSVNSSLNTG